ncbi:hypothetical protein PHSC3_001197 [Chlamydiales bacterium STE3]|nr:hypothetical protein PHSC3_001197 [Chlamydiales bacterium STE3]
MRSFFNNLDQVRPQNGFILDSDLEQRLPVKVKYKNRFYSLNKALSRKLTKGERFLAFFECLTKTVFSLGSKLTSKDFRDKWKSVFSGKMVQAIYLMDPDTEASKTHNIFNPVQNSSLSDETRVEEEFVIPPQTTPPLVSLDSLLSELPLEEGLNLEVISEENKQVLKNFAQKWEGRENVDQLHWPLEQLSKLLNVEQEELQRLFYSIQIFTGPELPLNSKALNWLFDSIQIAIRNNVIARVNPGIDWIWFGRIIVSGQENRFPSGLSKLFWTIDDLSMFLAVEKDKLVILFNSFELLSNENGFYDSQEIDSLFRELFIRRSTDIQTNRLINNLLNNNRTQKNSLRFAMNKVRS